MTKRDLTIWAAGFFDGEGCVSISRPVNKRGKRRYIGYQLQIIVAQRDRRPMGVLVTLFGGCLSPVRIHKSVYWYYRLHGNKAASFLEKVLPYLQLKRNQAELALRFQEYVEATNPQSRRRPNGQRLGRSKEEVAVLDNYYRQSRVMNARKKQHDWTTDSPQIDGGSALVQ